MFWKTFKPALILMGFFTLLLGIIYPLFVYGIGQVFFHHKANGSLYYDTNQQVVGSMLIAQNFTNDGY
ncbi:potassium-transporting ATPase subunit C, partial [Streptomyces caeruleatus]